MATRREKCQWCRLKLLVPAQAQSARCPYCQNITDFRHGHNIHDDDSYYYSYPQVINGNPQYWGPSDRYSYNNGGNNIYGMNMNSPNYMPQVQVSPPNVHGRRRAVLCGISYKGHPKALKGSVNDVLCMKYLLVERLGFPCASVIVLTEEEKDPYRIPTKSNIRTALRWLVQGSQAGDSLVFHYSGHGSRVRDRDGDEVDGHDEALCPLDYETEGKMLDDEINALIVSPLPRGATLHAIIDTCFSGTFLDLPFMCRMNREGYYLWEDNRIPLAAYKGTRGGLAISISACDDHQNSGDTTIFTGTASGALTYSFIQILERKQQSRLTYGYLLSAMRNNIHNAQNGRVVLYGGGGTRTVATASEQEPQLSSSEQFDVHSKLFVL